MDSVDFTILAATSVLDDMIEKCPPAETCRDAFDRMAKSTVKMCMSTTGFGSSGQGLDTHSNIPKEEPGRVDQPAPQPNLPPRSRPQPHFDMSLTDLLRTSPPQPAPSRLAVAVRPSIKSELPNLTQEQSQAYLSNDSEILPYPPSTAGSYQDFSYAATADIDMGFLPGWESDMHEGFAHGLVWENADHDFSDGHNGGLPDLFEGFYFGGPGNL